jgi:hypothetical protein
MSAVHRKRRLERQPARRPIVVHLKQVRDELIELRRRERAHEAVLVAWVRGREHVA